MWDALKVPLPGGGHGGGIALVSLAMFDPLTTQTGEASPLVWTCPKYCIFLESWTSLAVMQTAQDLKLVLSKLNYLEIV